MDKKNDNFLLLETEIEGIFLAQLHFFFSNS